MTSSHVTDKDALKELPFSPLHIYETKACLHAGYTARQHYSSAEFNRLNAQLKAIVTGEREREIEGVEELKKSLGDDLGRREFVLGDQTVFLGDLLTKLSGFSEDESTAIFLTSTFVAGRYVQGGYPGGVNNFAWGQITRDYKLMAVFQESEKLVIEKKTEDGHGVIYLTFSYEGQVDDCREFTPESLGSVKSQSTFTIRKNPSGNYEITATGMTFFGTQDFITRFEQAQKDFIKELTYMEKHKNDFYDSIIMLIPALVDKKSQEMFFEKVKTFPREVQEKIRKINTRLKGYSPLKELLCKIYSTYDWSWKKLLSQPLNVGEMFLAVFEGLSLQAFAKLSSVWDTKNILQIAGAFIVGMLFVAPVYAAASIGRQVLMRLTSPIRSFNEAYDVGHQLGGRVVGGLFAGTSALVSIGLLVVASVFLAPVVGAVLAKMGVSSFVGPLAEGLATKIGIVSAPSIEVAFSIGIVATLIEGMKYLFGKWSSKQSIHRKFEESSLLQKKLSQNDRDFGSSTGKMPDLLNISPKSIQQDPLEASNTSSKPEQEAVVVKQESSSEISSPSPRRKSLS